MAQGIRRFSPFNPLNGWVENEHRCRKSQIPCKIPCLQGIDTETGANGTPAPAKQSDQTADSPNLSRKARIGRLFRRAGKSPGGKIGPITRPIPKNLRLTPQKLPFSGDCARRLGSIFAGWPAQSGLLASLQTQWADFGVFRRALRGG